MRERTMETRQSITGDIVQLPVNLSVVEGSIALVSILSNHFCSMSLNKLVKLDSGEK
jgi:hypothetical protein